MTPDISTPPLLQKGHCEDCSHYLDCPRMRGHPYCYSSPTYQAQDEHCAAQPVCTTGQEAHQGDCEADTTK